MYRLFVVVVVVVMLLCCFRESMTSWGTSLLRYILLQPSLAGMIISTLDVKSIGFLAVAFPELCDHIKRMIRYHIGNIINNRERIQQLLTAYPDLPSEGGTTWLKELHRKSHHEFVQNVCQLIFDYINGLINIHIGEEFNDEFPCCQDLLDDEQMTADCALIANGNCCWSSEQYHKQTVVSVLNDRAKICNLAVAQHTFHNFITGLVEGRTTEQKKKKKKKMKKAKYCSSITLRVQVPVPFWANKSGASKREFTITTHVLTHDPRSEVTAHLIELFNSKYQSTTTATASSSSLSHPKVEVGTFC